MKKLGNFFALFSFFALVSGGFIACSNGSSGGSSGDSSGTTTTSTVKAVETTGSIAVPEKKDGVLVAKCTDSEGGVYEFKQAESNASAAASTGKTWTYTKNGKCLYEGTFEGDLSQMKQDSELTVKLTISKYEGKSVKEAKEFDFAVSSDGKFTATIPEVKVESSSGTAVVKLPPSVGTNILAGNTYSLNDGDEIYDESFTFAADTFVYKEIEDDATFIETYKYTYDADNGLLYACCTKFEYNGKVCTNFDEMCKLYAEIFGCTADEAKKELGVDIFSVMTVKNIYELKEDLPYLDSIKAGSINVGNYLYSNALADMCDFEFECYADDEIGSYISLSLDEIRYYNNTKNKIEIIYNGNNFSGEGIAGTVKEVTKASKTLKELYEKNESIYDNEANGSAVVVFTKLPADLQGFKTGTEYKFFFDTDDDYYIKK